MDAASSFLGCVYSQWTPVMGLCSIWGEWWNRWGRHKGFATHNKRWRIPTGLRASNFPSTSVTFSPLHTLKVGLLAVSGSFDSACPKLTAILFVRTRCKVKETHFTSLTLWAPDSGQCVYSVSCAVHTCPHAS